MRIIYQCDYFGVTKTMLSKTFDSMEIMNDIMLSEKSIWKIITLNDDKTMLVLGKI